MNSLSWQVAAATDKGCLRKDNQDNFYISPEGKVFVVADGMGGEAGGALASRLAVEAVAAMFAERQPADVDDEQEIQRWLFEAVSRANAAVYAERCNNPKTRRLGTTIVIVVQTESGRLHIAHLGDSRAYRISADGSISVLTQDHSVAFELVMLGKLAPEQYETSPFRNYLTRCVGHDAQVKLDQSPCNVAAGDWILLCTDGLTGEVREREICEIVCASATPEEACAKLIELTLERGAKDNVTVLCAQYADKTALINA